MHVLTFSSLFPNEHQPERGIFVEHRLRQLVASGGVCSTVVAPVPWFPSRSRHFGEYATFARVPRREMRFGLEVLHPRYPVVPKIGMSIAPMLMAMALLPAVRRLCNTRSIDLIDAHYFYPDGVAAAMLGHILKVPVVITARGTDINLIPTYRVARKQIVRAGRACAAMIAVCEALKSEMVSVGLDASKITVLRNGVDLQLFTPRNRRDARQVVGARRRVLLSVGYLIERKRHDLVITALPHLPEYELFVIGSGPEKHRLISLAEKLQVMDRVTFVGSKPQQALVDFYSAAEALVLMSSREGMANVLLESLACGTPVVVRDAWGAPEIVSSDVAGRLVRDTNAKGLAEVIRFVTSSPASTSEAVRRHAEQFSWEATSAGQLEVFRSALAQCRKPVAGPGRGSE